MKTKSTFPPHIAEIHVLAIETFGTKSKADNWLDTIHPILGNSPNSTA